ncbi:trichothecene 3-O-acetyltransferas-like protein [Cucurbitaria berberidis CBS 394.84]|uniref:Trichothecene 3-O-acetyltransferas-like protein n=1 Tax=Cucurbitaria berberidis CBS 394.84 TaxID=1168544 RepID=A0A9P4GR54_9PLEO|nr:trichothecene 3-O-acetyltransferas-like protein [Cucurbitaria berberidis CBS 394.84]KAF1849789.1 trichothecene 3-O-acetyltransferas-like protein [Cucurbitaria berberidis CBS 394.84]
MIVKSESPPPLRTKSFHLSFVDQNVVRVYTQTLSVFPFPDHNEAEAAIQALGDGLRLTLQRFPFLAGTLSLSDRAAGTLSLQYPAEVSNEEMSNIFRSKQIPFHEESFPHTYEQLKRDGMPPSAFKSAMFVPEDFANYPGIPPSGEGKVDFGRSDAPVMRVQAYFIPGGLVLSMYTHHTVLDFSGVATFWRAFCSNHHRSLLIRPASTSVAEEQSSLRLAIDEQGSSDPHKRSAADCYCDGTYSYPKTLPKDTSCTQRLFVISAARIREYRDQLRPYFPKNTPPTQCNVLAALVWTHVTRARAARLTNSGYTETNIGIATDLRRRQHPPVPATYMGNMALFSKGTLDIADLTAEDRVTQDTILHVIRKIKDTILAVNDDWITRHLTFFKSIKQITDTECALALSFGSDIYITSWLNFGADLHWGIPGTDLDKNSLAGRPEFIRRSYGPGDGGMIFLPRRIQPAKDVEAPFEVLVRLAEEDMDRLLNEEGGLKSWADAVIE